MSKRFTKSDVEAHQQRHGFAQAAQKCAPMLTAMRERDLHAAIIAECKRRGWICFHGSMAHSTFRTEGEPDFVILAPELKREIPIRGEPMSYIGVWPPRTFLIEAKSSKGKLSPAQRAIHAWAAKLGHTIHVVRSFEQFLDVIGNQSPIAAATTPREQVAI